jgi:hypothetical protein
MKQSAVVRRAIELGLNAALREQQSRPLLEEADGVPVRVVRGKPAIQRRGVEKFVRDSLRRRARERPAHEWAVFTSDHESARGAEELDPGVGFQLPP